MLAEGKYPLGIQKLETIDKNEEVINIRKAAKSLIKFEQKLLGKNKKRKRKINDEPGEKGKVKKQKVLNNDNYLDDGNNKLAVNSKKKIKSKNNGSSEITKNVGKIKKLNVVDIFEGNQAVGSDIKTKKPNEKHDDTNKQLKGNAFVEKNMKVKSKKATDIVENIECVFERNSGTWTVFDVSNEPETNLVPNNIGT